jgi:5-methylcytosine-specific restriction endonuclease McrA
VTDSDRDSVTLRLRDEILARDGYRCRFCNSRYRLAIHHRTYVRLYNESFDDLCAICDQCHDTFHKYRTLAKD